MLKVIFHRVFTEFGSQRVKLSGKFLRSTSVVLLCLLFLISNTGVLPSLNQGKSCHCATELQTTSQCCCFNSRLAERATKSKPCCSTKKQPTTQSCCSNQEKRPANSETESQTCQVSSICGCSNSAKDGLSIVNPWYLNPRLTLTTANELKIPLKILNDLPIKRAFAPETPPPQLNTL